VSASIFVEIHLLSATGAERLFLPFLPDRLQGKLPAADLTAISLLARRSLAVFINGIGIAKTAFGARFVRHHLNLFNQANTKDLLISGKIIVKFRPRFVTSLRTWNSPRGAKGFGKNLGKGLICNLFTSP
jgi:hypothetical protein